MQVNFGAGTCLGKRTDVANQQNAFFGITQEWSLDIDQKLVTLIGQNKDPVDVAPSERTTTGKLKFARVQANTFGNFAMGVIPTPNAGFDIIGPETNTPTTTTFAVASASTLTEDLGLFYHSSGIALSPVTAAPSVGQYIAPAPATGIYTIAAGDENKPLDAYYMVSTTNLFEVDINSALMGTGPTVELDISVPYSVQGVPKKLNFQIYAVRMGKLSLNFKNTGYFIPEFDFTCFTNPSGALMRWASTE